MSDGYVHGYDAAEGARLVRQASILVEFIHGKVAFAPGLRILEAGCGTGAQTVQLALRSPHARFVSVDRSAASLAIARERLAAHALQNVELQLANIQQLPFADQQLDGAFLCFVIEHLPAPERALSEIRRVLRPGAPLHVFEGDHGSVLAWPDDPAITRLVSAACQYQRLQGGDACIGRRLYRLLSEAGFRDVTVEPCVAYADAARPAWVEGFTNGTFIDMMKLQRDAVLERDLLSAREWQDGLAALERTSGVAGTFCYTFFRATAQR